MKYQYLIFDIDGTLTDSKEGIAKCVQYSLEKMGREIPKAEDLDPFIGPPLAYSYKTYMGMSEEETNEAIRLYRERYSTIGKYENRPYDGIIPMLGKLRERGYILATASSKPEQFVLDIMDHFEMSSYFHFIVGSIPTGNRNSKEEVMEEAFRQLGIVDEEAKKKTIMIGDRHFDINGAKYFGIDSIGVKYGFAPEGELEEAGATYVVDTVADLEKLLLES